jgi:peptidoglycan/LPS O-acetylase OafA/YrhL
LKESSTSPRSTGEYIPTLDGWRAVAIGLVLAYHGKDSFAGLLSPSVNATLETVLKVHGVGLLGVRIFFAISGFLITRRILSDEEATGGISLKSFYLRRAFRILPASLLFTSVIGLLAVFHILPVPFFAWLAAVLCFINYQTRARSWYLGHYWSLAIEEHFYLLWPGFLRAVSSPRRRLGIAIVLAYAVGIWRAVAFKYGITYTSARDFWGRTDVMLDGLLWGCILALTFRLPPLKALLVKVTAPWFWIAGVTLIAVIIAISPKVGWKAGFALLSLLPMVIALMVVGTTLHPTTTIARFLETPAMRWVGRISYSLYLWQQIFLISWGASLPSEANIPGIAWLQRLPFNFIAAFACAACSYYFIERPLIKIGHRLAAKPNRP